MAPQTTAYRKRYALDRHRGIRRTVPIDPARQHIAHLEGLGMSRRSIAAAAGVAATTITRLMDPAHDSANRAVIAKVLTVTGPASVLAARPDVDDETFVPAIGARRRIRALLALGWTHEQQREVSGLRGHLILSQQGRWITARNHRRIDTAYRALSTQPGPSDVTRRRAAAAGWPPPAAWDDIDDPTEEPTGWQREAPRFRRGAELVEDLADLAGHGETLDHAAERLGVTTTNAQQHLRRADRQDILDAYARNALQRDAA